MKLYYLWPDPRMNSWFKLFMRGSDWCSPPSARNNKGASTSPNYFAEDNVIVTLRGLGGGGGGGVPGKDCDVIVSRSISTMLAWLEMYTLPCSAFL